MNDNFAFTVNPNDGNISIFHLEGNDHDIGKSHPSYDQVLEIILEISQTGDYSDLSRLAELVDVRRTIAQELDGVRIDEEGNVFYEDVQLHNVVTNRIVEFLKAGLPWQPLARFLENLMANPSRNSVEQLYTFLDANPGMAITPDGCFIGYKGVNENFTDKHTGKFDNSVGQHHSVPRNQVDDIPTNTCSYGFHVGSHKYAKSFAGSGGKLMLVKVNPRDAVSVPTDGEKLRVCAYDVVSLAEENPIEDALVTEEGQEFHSDMVESIDAALAANDPGLQGGYDDDDGEDWEEEEDDWDAMNR